MKIEHSCKYKKRLLELGIVSPIRTFKYCDVGQYITSSINHKIVADENTKNRNCTPYYALNVKIGLKKWAKKKWFYSFQRELFESRFDHLETRQFFNRFFKILNSSKTIVVVGYRRLLIKTVNMNWMHKCCVVCYHSFIMYKHYVIQIISFPSINQYELRDPIQVLKRIENSNLII